MDSIQELTDLGELSQAGIQHITDKHLKEANEKRAEADKLAKTDPTKAEALRSEAKAIEAEYGIGSPLQMGIRAATAALQGLATGSVESAAVGALSPYANKLIKEYTTNPDQTTNTEANLIAHTILGAIEAQVTGNNAAAEAVGAFTAEAAAPYMMQALYGTNKVENLTDSQKQNIANLSQIAAGLSGGLVGDSTASGVVGAEVGKRAVENNLLKAEDDEYVYQRNKEFEKQGYIAEKYKQGTKDRLLKDAYINLLIQKYQNDPNSLSYAEQNYLNTELPQIARSYGISVEDLYKWNFSNTIKRDDSKLSKYLVLDDQFWN